MAHFLYLLASDLVAVIFFLKDLRLQLLRFKLGEKHG